MKSSLQVMLQKCFNGPYNSKSPYIIAIQGCSTSGKSTFAHALFDKISSNSCRPYILTIDDFYKDNSGDDRIVKGTVSYDYDSPSSFDWQALVKCVKSILNNDDIIKASKYSYVTKKREDMAVKNKGFNVIIVEGIFAQNIFNNKVFNVEEMTSFDSKKTIKHEFVDNTYGLGTYPVLKVFMNLCDSDILKFRVKIDQARDGKNAEESAEMVKEYVLPATNRWVRPSALDQSDFVLQRGTRDIEECNKVFTAIATYFGKDASEEFKEYLMKLSRQNEIEV